MWEGISEPVSWSLQNEVLRVVVTQAGGRIASVRFQEKEFLETEAVQRGNVFWTSPQSDWEWPPLPEHDSEDYQAMVDGAVLRLRSKVDAKLNLRIVKEYRFLKENQLEIKYGIVNQGKSSRKVAPWEITRVPAKGKTSFEIDEDSPSWGNLKVSATEGMVEFNHQEEHDQKYFAFARNGALHHEHGGVKLTKSFPYCPPAQAAPGEAAIEIYAAETYVEVEQQGAWVEVEPGEILWWTVVWTLSQSS